MRTLLLVTALKPGALEGYKKFVAEITGLRKKEYRELLQRYGLKTAKVWIENISGRDCVIIVHEAEDDAHARRKSFSSSTHPFDLWFGEQLKMYYEKFPEPAHLLFKFDASH